jgi:hypothetical protein
VEVDVLEVEVEVEVDDVLVLVDDEVVVTPAGRLGLSSQAIPSLSLSRSSGSPGCSAKYSCASSWYWKSGQFRPVDWEWFAHAAGTATVAEANSRPNRSRPAVCRLVIPPTFLSPSSTLPPDAPTADEARPALPP